MRNFYDLQSLFYLAAYVGLIAWQWVHGISWAGYAGLLFMAIGIQLVHHNHVHLGIWHSKRLNQFTNHIISILSAVPSAMMYGGHLKNHHVHQHGPEDVTRTYRFGGDHNHLLGYLLHPFQAYAVLIPKFYTEFKQQWPQRTRFAKDMALQISLIGIAWLVLALLDWQKFLLLVILPQIFGMHWLLGSNYLQHAHCDDDSEVDYARNFTGAVNWIWFNIGFHTAHHDHPRAHWSTLRKIHEQRGDQIDPRLCCRSFVGYVAKTFLISPVVKSFRSQTLRKTS